MSDDLFQEGGPLKIKRTGIHEYEFRITIPEGVDGFVGRECPDSNCFPRYFKVKPGTGLPVSEVYCPYCRRHGHSRDFITEAQLEYGKNLVQNEAMEGTKRLIQNSLGLGPTGRKKLGGGLLSIEISLKSTQREIVPMPLEEKLRRDLVCPNCSLAHAVFGLATWCPDCGEDIFLAHLHEELAALKAMLSNVANREDKLGTRVAVRDLENCLEDVVSIFEATMKHIVRRYLRAKGMTLDEIDILLERQIRNGFQNIDTAIDLAKLHLNYVLFKDLNPEEIEKIKLAFNKRHPITHNLGLADGKYLHKVGSAERKGRELELSSGEIQSIAELCARTLSSTYRDLFLFGKP